MSIKTQGLQELITHLDMVIKKLEPIKGEVFSAGAVQNGRRYEHYVQSADSQAQVHQGRWQTDADVAARNTQEIVDDFTKEVQGIIGKGRGDLRRAMARALALLRDDLRDYPPPPAGSRYVRTMTLKNSWYVRYL